MQDRVPLYPGRVQLVPVAGMTNFYTLTRADQPTQEGTPLNTATLLQDATAALYGLPSTAVPDDVFAAIPGEIYGNIQNAKPSAFQCLCTGGFI